MAAFTMKLPSEKTAENTPSYNLKEVTVAMAAVSNASDCGQVKNGGAVTGGLPKRISSKTGGNPMTYTDNKGDTASPDTPDNATR